EYSPVVHRLSRSDVAKSPVKELSYVPVLDVSFIPSNKIVHDFNKVLAARDDKMVPYLLAPDIDWWFHGPAAHKYNLMQVLTGRRGGSSNSSYRKDDCNRRYDGDDSEDIMRTSAALVNLQLDRKTRNLTNSWRLVSHSMYMEAAFMTHDQ
nr:hypothetical protein [Tanacetum cinerariifolium]